MERGGGVGRGEGKVGMRSDGGGRGREAWGVMEGRRED